MYMYTCIYMYFYLTHMCSSQAPGGKPNRGISSMWAAPALRQPLNSSSKFSIGFTVARGQFQYPCSRFLYRTVL